MAYQKHGSFQARQLVYQGPSGVVAVQFARVPAEACPKLSGTGGSLPKIASCWYLQNRMHAVH